MYKGYLKIEDTGENEAFDEDEKIMKIIKNIIRFIVAIFRSCYKIIDKIFCIK